MTYDVRLREEADRDLTEAALWYELHGIGLGYLFLDEVLRVLASIAEHPFTYPVSLPLPQGEAPDASA